jgi:hypothetical protein
MTREKPRPAVNREPAHLAAAVPKKTRIEA